MTWVGGIACALAVNLAVLAPEPWLVVAGAVRGRRASATMDVSMNSHGRRSSRGSSRPIMSSLHAAGRSAGMVGAAFAALLTALGVDARVAVAIASALLLAAVLAFARRIGAGLGAPRARRPPSRCRARRVVLIALLCLLIMVTEGAMARLGRPRTCAVTSTPRPRWPPWPFAFFTAGMTAGRLIGDADQPPDRAGHAAAGGRAADRHPARRRCC